MVRFVYSIEREGHDSNFPLRGLAALIQSRVSKNDEFDFKAYADLRIQEYLDYKAEKFGTREAEGKELPLRERCWAREY